MKYVSILRGINVGGQKSIKMADLKALYESLGYQNVVTYIQSGNVIFDAASGDRIGLKSDIEAAIEDKYAFHVPVEIRTNRDLADIISSCPYNPVDLMENGTKVLITFLSSPPLKEKLSDLHKYVVEPEQLVVIGREAYLYCPNGYGKSKLSNNFLEQKLGIAATTRNWKSVHKLNELSST